MSIYWIQLALFSFLSLLPNAFSLPRESTKPPLFLLAGDSTTATQAANGGGWGDGFLNTTLYHGAWGKNFGHNGATTVSFREGGDWSRVISTAKEYNDDYTPFVTIQFGHNDQKPAKNISIDEFSSNLQRMATEVLRAGATPILVTPLSRRNYDDSSGNPEIVEDLQDWRDATINAAMNVQSKYIDLNKESIEYLNSIGPENAYTYNLNTDDHTHLNIEGSKVFGGMVAVLILEEFPSLKHSVRVDSQLRKAIDNGQYYWP